MIAYVIGLTAFGLSASLLLQRSPSSQHSDSTLPITSGSPEASASSGAH